MGTTFVSINENGFWVRDGILGLWLRLAALHIPEPSDDIAIEDRCLIYDVRNKWLLASKGYFGGCVPDCIDEIVLTEIGKLTILNSGKLLIDRLKKSPPYLNKDMINLLGEEGSNQMGDLETWRMIEIGQAILDLVNGKKFGTSESKNIGMPGCGSNPQ